MKLSDFAGWLFLCAALAGCATARRGSESAREPECLMDAETVEVPLTNDRGYQWRAEVEVNGVPGTFILDTGADYTLLSESFARTAGLWKGARRGHLVNSEGRRENARFALITHLRLGGASFVQFYAPVLDLRKLTNAAGYPVDGILGNNLLNQVAYQVDWGRNRLTLQSLSTEPPAGAIPIAVRTNRVFFNARVNGRDAEFALDTGAYRCSIATTEIKRLQMPPDKLSETDAPGIDITGTQPPRRTEVRVDTFQAGPIVRTNYALLTWQHNVLGMDLLRDWTLRVDARRGWMSLTPPAAEPAGH